MNASKNCATIRQAPSKLNHTTGEVNGLTMNDGSAPRPVPQIPAAKPSRQRRPVYEPAATRATRAF
jgi:hypothetical protein